MDLWSAAIIVAIVVMCLWQVTVGFAFPIAIQLVLSVLGMATMVQADEASSTSLRLFTLSTAVFIVGYFISLRVSRVSAGWTKRTLSPLPDRSIWAVVIFAGVLSMYHVFAIGIPLLSSNVETERFDFTSSGFFGIPGRMYLFGATISWIAACANAQAWGISWHKYRPWQFATVCLVLTSVLGGFKGQLWALILTVIAVYVVVSGVRVTLGTMITRYWWAGILGLIYFAVVAARYPTYQETGRPVGSLLYDRLTLLSAQPAVAAMEHHAVLSDGIPILNDFTYFIGKYAGNPIPGGYSFERAVSASMIGVDPSSDAWTVPVTIGAFPETFVSFGLIAGLAVMFLSGAALGYGEIAPSRSTFGLIWRAVIGLLLSSWLIKGGLAYHAINFAAVVALLALVGWLAAVLLPRGQRPQTARRDTDSDTTELNLNSPKMG